MPSSKSEPLLAPSPVTSSFDLDPELEAQSSTDTLLDAATPTNPSATAHRDCPLLNALQLVFILLGVAIFCWTRDMCEPSSRYFTLCTFSLSVSVAMAIQFFLASPRSPRWAALCGIAAVVIFLNFWAAMEHCFATACAHMPQCP